MLRWAIINSNTNIVDNVILWDGESVWEPPLGFYVVKIEQQSVVHIGFSYNKTTKKWIEPEYPPLPTESN
jgi:hypothetical protein